VKANPRLVNSADWHCGEQTCTAIFLKPVKGLGLFVKGQSRVNLRISVSEGAPHLVQKLIHPIHGDNSCTQGQ
jgi:hypothetical protein